MPLYPLFLGGYAVTTYALLHRLSKNKSLSLLLTLVSLTAPKLYEQSFIAYVNLPYSAYLITGAVYISLWVKYHKKSDLIMGLLLSMCSFWSRNFPFALVNLGLVFIYSPFPTKIKRIAVLLATLSGLFLIIKIGTKETLTVLNYLKWSVWNYYQPFSLIFILLLLSSLFNKNRHWFWISLIIGYVAVLIFGTLWMVSRQPAWLQVPDALQRMTLFLAPAIIWVGFEIALTNPKNNQ
jgi:hypothetical protein